jgi:hypothetical protein
VLFKVKIVLDFLKIKIKDLAKFSIIKFKDSLGMYQIIRIENKIEDMNKLNNSFILV